MRRSSALNVAAACHAAVFSIIFTLTTLVLPICPPAAVASPAGKLEIDSAGHPLVRETPRLDRSVSETPSHTATPKLFGGVADWTFADLGIEYEPMGVKGPHKITITKIHLGTWAARSGLRTGDVILELTASSDGYSITIDRDGTVYRTLLSHYEGKKLTAQSDKAKENLHGEVAETAVNKLSADAHGQSHPSNAISRKYNGLDIYTELNLALCVPEPTDVYGGGQWDLLAKERTMPVTMTEWEAWQTELRERLSGDWPRAIPTVGKADMHVIVRDGSVVDVSLIHDTAPGEFAERALGYMRSIHAPFPKHTQVSEIHLEVKFGRADY